MDLYDVFNRDEIEKIIRAVNYVTHKKLRQLQVELKKDYPPLVMEALEQYVEDIHNWSLSATEKLKWLLSKLPKS